MIIEYKSPLDKLLNNTNHKLLYITEYGSKLYGTNNENSDIDLKGLFLLDIKDLILQSKCNSISYTSGNNDTKNSSSDVDIQLWSLHYWLYLLSKGDTNAIDLLFSIYSNGSNEEYKDNMKEILGEFYNSPLDLIDLYNNRAYISYSYNQCMKYNWKGSKVEMIKKLLDFFKSKYTLDTQYTKLDSYIDEVLSTFDNRELVFEDSINNGKERCLYIIGKGYNGSITLQETIERLEYKYKVFGNRAKLASENNGIDWKGVSHSLRVLYEVIELVDTKFLRFPLKEAKFIKEVKEGKYNYMEDIEPILNNLLEEAKSKIVTISINSNMRKNHEKILYNYYSKFLR